MGLLWLNEGEEVMKIECPCCKNTIKVEFYLYDAKIKTNSFHLPLEHEEWVAQVKGKAICPLCGTLMEPTFAKRISVSDIEKFVCDKQEKEWCE